MRKHDDQKLVLGPKSPGLSLCIPATNLYTPLLYFADSHFMKHNVFIIWLMLTPIHGLLAKQGDKFF